MAGADSKYSGRQWRERLDLWSRWFPAHWYEKKEEISVKAFVTKECLPFDSALQSLKKKARSVKEGEKWGCFWEYGWFLAEWTAPEELEGQRIIFVPGVGEEMLIWINGRESGAVDKKHGYVTLSQAVKAGEHFQIVMECYAGHGPRMEGGCMVRKGEEAFSQTDGPQQIIAPSFAAVWKEEIFQTGMDFLTLYSLLTWLPERSLRAMKVLEGLKRFIVKADLEAPEDRLLEMLSDAGQELKPLLACVNGSTAPDFSVFGQSHLDLAWLWTQEETRRKAARTYGNQLALMEEYPEYRFLLCEPPILEYLKESYPCVWERVKQKVKEGQIFADGAVYVEGDMNMPCGESLARQFLYGKEWFREEFGVDSKVAWMPDTFGYTGALPQIMKQCGVEYFATQKLIRQDPECEPFPYNVFWWQGIDGSRVLAHTYKENNAETAPAKLMERWEKDRVQEEGIDSMLYPFGYGDGGGGPICETLEYARRCTDLEGAPRVRYESPEQYFQRLEEAGSENVFAGELYLAWHRGTYTAQARTKLGVRRAECVLKEAEYWNSVLTAWQICRGIKDGDRVERAERLRKLWKRLLFQEFHDILTGTGIARVHEEAEKELGELAAQGRAGLEECLSRLEELASELPEKNRLQEEPVRLGSCTQNDDVYLESGYLYAQLDRAGRVRRLALMQDGKMGKQFGSETEPMNEFRLYRNVNSYYDAWEIGRMYEQEEEAIHRSGWRLTQDGCEGRPAWRLDGRIGDSVFSQWICMSGDGKGLEFHTRMDWQERHRMLKVDFPSVVHSGEVIGETAFGAQRRPARRSMQWEKDRYEVCSQRYSAMENGREGMAVLNDCKYGWSARENCISLTLLRAPLMPDQNADQGIQEFAYACRPYEGSFGNAGIIQAAAGFNKNSHLDRGMRERAERLEKEFGLLELGTADRAGGVSKEAEGCHVAVESVKLSEDGKGDLVVRLYEAAGVPQRVKLSSRIPILGAEETDILERRKETKIPEEEAREGIILEFRAFEIKTVRFLLRQDAVSSSETEEGPGKQKMQHFRV